MNHHEMEFHRPTAPANTDSSSLRRAVTALSRLLAMLGPGEHHIVSSRGFTDVAAAHITLTPLSTGMVISHSPLETMELTALLARAFSGPQAMAGALVVRTQASRGTGERVRGWRLRDGWLLPLTEGEVFSAYCTDALTGDPLSPESDVQYSAGLSIPTPEEIS
ncbi:hypothetical protein [Streptomyces xanthochromogenes]|uniref:hypothetical protein n=1 Tax=Streptomyces xanthochromogenes TaxID=67384 RepID=UPI003448FB4A